MDQYKDEDMAIFFNKYKETNKVVQCIDKPSILKLIGDLRGMISIISVNFNDLMNT